MASGSIRNWVLANQLLYNMASASAGVIFLTGLKRRSGGLALLIIEQRALDVLSVLVCVLKRR
jgi:hypothetical protein